MPNPETTVAGSKKDFVNPNHVAMQHSYCLHVLSNAIHLLDLASKEIERLNPGFEKLPVMRKVVESMDKQLEGLLQ